MKPLKKVPFFTTLSDSEIAALSQRMKRQQFAAGDLIFAEGDPGDALYLIETGLVRIVSDAATEAQVYAHLSEGDFFGEMALLTGKPRSAAVRAVTDVSAWTLTRDDFEQLLGEHPSLAITLSRVLGARLIHADRRLVEQHLRRMILFEGLTDEEIATVARRLHPKQYKKGWLIFAEGEPATAMYLIETGQVKVVTDAETEREILAILGEGDFFGELALLTGETRSAAVKAATDVDLWILNKADFEAIVAAYPSVAMALSRRLIQRLEQANRQMIRVATQLQRRPAPALLPSMPQTVTAPVRPVLPRPQPARMPLGMRLNAPFVALRQSVQGAQAWMAGRSRAAQLRMALVALLLAWLVGVSLPTAILARVNEASSVVTGDRAPLSGSVTTRGGNLIALLSAPTPTSTLAPTLTPTPTNTPTPTFTPVPPTATPTVTETPVPPTATPTETQAPRIVIAAAPQPPAEPPTPTPVPEKPREWDGRLGSVVPTRLVAFDAQPGQTYWRLVKAQFQDVKNNESGGNHNIYIYLIDEAGKRVTGQSVIISWGGEQQILGPANEKPANDYCGTVMGCNFDFPMYGADYAAQVQGPSDRVEGMVMPMRQHVNYVLTFQRTTK